MPVVSETELLPCPFCGSLDLSVYSNADIGCWVACVDCGLETPTETGTTPDDATKYWNTRALTAALSDQVADEQREPTPHWDRKWPHDQPNGWNLDAAKFLAIVQSQKWLWHFCGHAKYIELRVDTRDGAFNLYDRDKKPLNPDDVIAAVERAKQEYSDEAAPPSSPAAGE